MSKFDLSEQICESTLLSYRKYIKNYNARDVADLIFLYFLGLQILKSSFTTVPFAIDYAKHTIQDNNFDRFKQSGTDLYILIHTLFGKDNETNLKLLKDQEASLTLLENIGFNVSDAKKWFSNIVSNRIDDNFDKRFLLKLETLLRIDTSDYRSIRRLVSDWSNLNLQQRQLATTRLIYALKTRANRSELLPTLNSLAKDENLFLSDTSNPEEQKKASLLKYTALGALATAGFGFYNLAKLANASIDKNVKENASAGATSAGAIASIPMPLANNPVLKRTSKTSTNNKKSKKKDK